jgi:glycosyltransferase involved in cell wall biosynthesis
MTSHQRRRVLLVHPSMQPPGGGNGVAAWALHALSREHHVTVLSWWPVAVDPINRFFGTDLHASDFDTMTVPARWRLLVDHLPVPAALLRFVLLMRYTRRIADRFEVIVGMSNETDFGRRGIQYVNYPTYLRPRPAVDLRWYHRWQAPLDAYYRFTDWLGDVSIERVKSNLTLANSDWAGAQVKRSLGIDAITVYPPVVTGVTPAPWADRQRRFLALGRISPEKEYERVMRILARVRARHPDLTLIIVGTCDRHTRAYYRGLRALAASLGSWISFRENLPRAEVHRLMASSRYGIHGMREEHFGMAPAEMASAGMLVWVPNGGGQVEIVGGEPMLRYDTEEQAADIIARVIDDPAEEQRLRDYLRERSSLFTAERFVRQMQEIVRAFQP